MIFFMFSIDSLKPILKWICFIENIVESFFSIDCIKHYKDNNTLCILTA